MLATVEEAFLTLTYGEIAAFVVSLPEPAKTSVPITYDLWIGPEERMEARTHVFSANDTYAVIQVPIQQVDYLVSSNQIIVQITSIDGDTNGPFDSASTTVLPLFMNPPLPQVSIGGGGDVIEGLSSTYVLLRSDAGGPLTVFYAVDNASTASASDYTGPIPAGAYAFSDGESIAHISMSAVDDTLMENSESVIVKILPSPSYMIGTERATKTIHDGFHGQVDAGQAVEWEDENGWKNQPNNEVMWDELPHRWIAQIPSGLGVEVTGIRWMKRPHDDPSAPWIEFTSAAPGEMPIAWPGIGHWDVKYFAYYDLGFAYFESTVYNWAGNNVGGVRFERGYEGQKYRLRPDRDEDEVFPENKDHEIAQHANREKVEVVVSLALVIPEGKIGFVKLRSFDPDHGHTPTQLDFEKGIYFDPNDIWEISPPDVDPVTRRPNDNRHTERGPQGELLIGEVGRLDTAFLTFEEGEQTEQTKLEIIHAQPGNNYIVAALPKRPSESQNILERVRFDDDAFTLKYEWNGEEKGVPRNKRTELLTVWRTLWLELDSMWEPTSTDPPPDGQGPFGGDPNHAEYDVNLGDLPNVPTTLLAPNFAPANIEVDFIPAGANRTPEGTFQHYVMEYGVLPGERPDKIYGDLIRNFEPQEKFWTVHLVGAYEHSQAQDFDDERAVMFGWSVRGTNTAYVYYEAIRDRSTYPGDTQSPPTVPQERLLNRTVLHESGHLMGAEHDAEQEIDGIMSRPLATYEPNDALAVFTIKHFAIFQWKAYPECNVTP